jgi:hypothetical protein
MPDLHQPDLHDAPPPATTAATAEVRGGDEARTRKVIRRLTIAANMAALPVAVLGAVLSFHSLSKWALPMYGKGWNYVVPFVIDFVIVSASLKFIAGAKKGQVVPGWRVMAHAGVAATLIFNAQAARDWTQVLGMDWPPLVWSIYVELTAAELIGEWRERHAVRRRRIRDKIPLRLWLTAPVESARVWLRMERRLDGEQADARLEVGIYAAALAALDDALPNRGGRRVRGIIRRQLRAGSLQPHDILIPLGWHTDEPALAVTEPRTVLRAVLRQALLRRGVDLSTASDAGTRAPASSPPPLGDGSRRRPQIRSDGRGRPDSTAPVGGGPAAGDPAAGGRVRPSVGARDDHHRIIDVRDHDVRDRDVRDHDVRDRDVRDRDVRDRDVRDRDVRDREDASARGDGEGTQSTGDRHEDATLVWRRCAGRITGKQMAAELGALGWPGVSERTALRIIQQVREAEEAHPTEALALARSR